MEKDSYKKINKLSYIKETWRTSKSIKRLTMQRRRKFLFKNCALKNLII